MVKLLLLSLALLFWSIPLFPIRIIILCLILIIVVNKWKKVQRPYIFGVLLAIYSLAFILSPVWNAAKTVEWKILLLLFLFISIPVLSYFSAGVLEFHFKFKDTKILTLLGGLLYLVNYIPLKADIAFRGDEDYHMSYILDMLLRFDKFFQYFSENLLHNWQFWLLILLILGGALFLLRFKKIYSLVLLFYSGIITFSFLMIFKFSQSLGSDFSTHFTFQALRYPSLQKWLEFFFVYPRFFSDIALYRLIPFLSMLLLSWFLYIKLQERIQSKLISFAFAFLFSTLPVLFFYTSLLYLEMPAILLMTVCVFELKSVLTVKIDDFMKNPVWYVLLLIPFLKETTLLFLLIVLGVRMVYQIHLIPSRGVIRALLTEGKLWVLVLSPLLIYLSFRSIFSNFQGHTLQLYKIYSPSYYLVEIKALFEQLGLFLPLALVGFILLLIKRKWWMLFSLGLLILGNLWVIIADSFGYLSYAGYSRWNLLFIPIFLYLSFYVLIHLDKKLQMLLVLFILTSNIYLIPIHPDGVRMPNWGSPLVDTAEYTYPYEKAIRWMANYGKTQNLLITGNYYHYDGIRFYFPKYNFKPTVYEYFLSFERVDKTTELILLDKLFKDLETGQALYISNDTDTILYQSTNNIDLNENKVYGNSYEIAKRISNSEHSIYIFSKL